MQTSTARSFGAIRNVETIDSDHEELTRLLQQQWKRLTWDEIEETCFIRREIALLIERKYGIRHTLMENYLSNLERTLPFNTTH